MHTQGAPTESSRRHFVQSSALTLLSSVPATLFAQESSSEDHGVHKPSKIDQSVPRVIFQGSVTGESLPRQVLQTQRGLYVIPVSWSGALPSGSHTMVYALDVRAKPRQRGEDFDATVLSAAINFLPPPEHLDLVNGVLGPVSKAVKGVNYQGLFGFGPHAFLPRHPILQLSRKFPVEVAEPIRVNDVFYRAVTQRAQELRDVCDYKVDAHYSPNERTTNCIGAAKGIAKYLPSPHAYDELMTGLLYGRAATDTVMRWLLPMAGIHPTNGRFGSPDDARILKLLRVILEHTTPKLDLSHTSRYQLTQS